MSKFPVALAILSLSSGLAHAADPAMAIPIYEQPAPRPTPQRFNWERCYAGVQVGQKDVSNRTDMSRTAFYQGRYIEKSTSNLMGPVAGGQIGCNYALADGFLGGFEVEGMWGAKNQIVCETQLDPASYCHDISKSYEMFGSGRFGYVFGPDSDGGLGGTYVYGRAGVGFTKTDIKTNVNLLSYTSAASGATWPAGTYVPVWAQNYDLTASKTFISPFLGVGVERALDPNWTIRADFSAMMTARSSANLTVSKVNYPYDAEGASLPNDPSGVTRNARKGDVIPIRIQEIETRLTVGLNRMF